MDTRNWLKMVDLILQRDWDPMGRGMPTDEYQSHVRPLAMMLRHRAPHSKLIAYLEWAETTNIDPGRSFNRERAEKVIASLQALGMPDKL
jgi:hypothetical protein